jgi:hypothetical protein
MDRVLDLKKLRINVSPSVKYSGKFKNPSFEGRILGKMAKNAGICCEIRVIL